MLEREDEARPVAAARRSASPPVRVTTGAGRPRPTTPLLESVRRRRLRRWLGILSSLAVLAAIGAYLHPFVERLAYTARLVRAKPDLPYPVPVSGVPPGRLTDQWGAPRSGGRRHQGIDIFARCGTPVLSATEGIVFTVGENALGGSIVRVLGPGGFWHYYAHLDRFGEVRRGDRIRAGTVVGYVGQTGNARGTPCHLHYGIYAWGGGAQNPYPLLTRSSPPPDPAGEAGR